MGHTMSSDWYLGNVVTILAVAEGILSDARNIWTILDNIAREVLGNHR